MSGILDDDEPQRVTGPTSGDAIGRGETPPVESKADQLIATEQQRSERQRIEAIQRQLRLETASRNRGFGLRSLFGALGSGRSSVLGSG